MVNDIFHDRDAACPSADFLDAGQRPTLHRSQRASVQPIAGQLLELLGGGHVHGNVGAPSVVDEREGFSHAFNPRFFDQQRYRLSVGGKSPVDDFWRFRDEQAFAGFKFVAKLDFRKICVCRHALVVNGIKMDELHVTDLSPNSLLDTRKPLVSKGFCWCPERDLNPHACINRH